MCWEGDCVADVKKRYEEKVWCEVTGALGCVSIEFMCLWNGMKKRLVGKGARLL